MEKKLVQKGLRQIEREREREREREGENVIYVSAPRVKTYGLQKKKRYNLNMVSCVRKFIDEALYKLKKYIY